MKQISYFNRIIADGDDFVFSIVEFTDAIERYFIDFSINDNSVIYYLWNMILEDNFRIEKAGYT